MTSLGDDLGPALTDPSEHKSFTEDIESSPADLAEVSVSSAGGWRENLHGIEKVSNTERLYVRYVVDISRGQSAK
jgi:hypothetical protein